MNSETLKRLGSRLCRAKGCQLTVVSFLYSRALPIRPGCPLVVMSFAMEHKSPTHSLIPKKKTKIYELAVNLSIPLTKT